MLMRVHKYLAACGVASRRQCEKLMHEGRVTVDGKIMTEPGAQMDPDFQEVCFDGRPVKRVAPVYLMLHKPPGIVCTSSDPQGRPCVVDLVPSEWGRIYSVGRLDTDSEGLILLTNDGDFALRLAHPRYDVRKKYELWLHEPLRPEEKDVWRRGIHAGDDLLRVLDIETLPENRSGFGYRITLGEGKNRHLRRMAEAHGKTVLRLKRVAVGVLQLGALKRGEWRMLTEKEIVTLAGKSEPKPRTRSSIK